MENFESSFADPKNLVSIPKQLIFTFKCNQLIENTTRTQCTGGSDSYIHRIDVCVFTRLGQRTVKFYYFSISHLPAELTNPPVKILSPVGTRTFLYPIGLFYTQTIQTHSSSATLRTTFTFCLFKSTSFQLLIDSLYLC